MPRGLFTRLPSSCTVSLLSIVVGPLLVLLLFLETLLARRAGSRPTASPAVCFCCGTLIFLVIRHPPPQFLDSVPNPPILCWLRLADYFAFKTNVNKTLKQKCLPCLTGWYLNGLTRHNLFLRSHPGLANSHSLLPAVLLLRLFVGWQRACIMNASVVRRPAL